MKELGMKPKSKRKTELKDDSCREEVGKAMRRRLQEAGRNETIEVLKELAACARQM
jgi:hypothetical protein